MASNQESPKSKMSANVQIYIYDKTDILNNMASSEKEIVRDLIER